MLNSFITEVGVRNIFWGPIVIFLMFPYDGFSDLAEQNAARLWFAEAWQKLAPYFSAFSHETLQSETLGSKDQFAFNPKLAHYHSPRQSAINYQYHFLSEHLQGTMPAQVAINIIKMQIFVQRQFTLNWENQLINVPEANWPIMLTGSNVLSTINRQLSFSNRALEEKLQQLFELLRTPIQQSEHVTLWTTGIFEKLLQLYPQILLPEQIFETYLLHWRLINGDQLQQQAWGLLERSLWQELWEKQDVLTPRRWYRKFTDYALFLRAITPIHTKDQFFLFLTILRIWKNDPKADPLQIRQMLELIPHTLHFAHESTAIMKIFSTHDFAELVTLLTTWARDTNCATAAAAVIFPGI